jgi:L-iditol 2-dehydrogenase
MIQAVLKQLKNIELENVERRNLREGEVRLRVISCAICGSDIRIYNHGNSRVKLPHVIGHEVVGKIIEVSDGCNLTVGDYCCFGADLPCDDKDCPYCSKGQINMCNKNYAIGYQFDGGFSEEMIIPETCWRHGAFKIIKNVTDEKDVYKYSLAEPLACAYHGVAPLHVTKEDNVLIFGGGPIGLMIGDICLNINLCKSVTVVELSDARIELIKKLFPNFTVVNSYALLDSDYDVVFTANSVPECHRQAIDIAAKNARVNLFGGLGTSELVPVDTNKIHYKQLMVTGTHGSNKVHFNKAVQLIENGKIDVEKYITAMYNLNDISKAFESAKNLCNLKIIVKPE